MDHLDRAGKRQRRLVLAAEHTAKFEREQGADALTARKKAVSHGVQKLFDIVHCIKIFAKQHIHNRIFNR